MDTLTAIYPSGTPHTLDVYIVCMIHVQLLSRFLTLFSSWIHRIKVCLLSLFISAHPSLSASTSTTTHSRVLICSSFYIFFAKNLNNFTQKVISAVYSSEVPNIYLFIHFYRIIRMSTQPQLEEIFFTFLSANIFAINDSLFFHGN